MLVFTSLQPFYDGISVGALTRVSLDNYRVLLGPGDLPQLDRQHAHSRCGDRNNRGAVHRACARGSWCGACRARRCSTSSRRCRWCFRRIILSVAFLDVFVNMPMPLYGTLISVIIASAVRYLPYGMRYAIRARCKFIPIWPCRSSVPAPANIRESSGCGQ